MYVATTLMKHKVIERLLRGMLLASWRYQRSNQAS